MITRIPFAELCAEVRARHLPVTDHSARVEEGGVFAVMPAPVPRGREYGVPGSEAYLAGVIQARPRAVVCEARHLSLLESLVPAGDSLAVALVDSQRAALGQLAAAAHGTDLACPEVIGITGTNGKTTTTYLLEALFAALGKKTGVIGTVSYRWPGFSQNAPLTTPGCLALHGLLADMRGAGVDVALMEVSSHALDQQRVAGIGFSGALLTNVTQDHLDFHGGMEEYFEAKARLFRPQAAGGVPLDGKACACNADDAYGRRILAERPGRIGFGLHASPAPGSRHLKGTITSLTPAGIGLVMEFEGRRWELSSPLVGGFNAMNLLGAQALALALGHAPEEFASLAGFSGVPGRLERIGNPAGAGVFVDYAHTPDALINALSALRDAGFRRIVAVFGCGGNRDRTKRPLMGEAVARLADVAVLTSDNPRHEKPEDIIADVLPGLASCREVVVEPNRRAALAAGLALVSGPEDALLVAGKGHETYQQIGDVKIPFSDQDTLRELLA